MQRFDFKRASYLERRRECARLAQEIGDEKLHFKPDDNVCFVICKPSWLLWKLGAGLQLPGGGNPDVQ
jgi:hypothetical protein